MKKILKWSLVLLAFGSLVSCSGSDDGEGDDQGKDKLVLNTDKTTIVGNGTDAVQFTILLGEEDVTASARIFNDTTGKYVMKGETTFASKEVGEVKFHAEYNNKKSEVVTITVEEVPEYIEFALVPSKKSIVPDGEDFVTFKVISKNEDVTSKSKIFNKTSGEELTENKFTLSSFTNTVFAAEYEGETTREVTVRFADFYKRVAILRFTSVSCINCPAASSAVAKAMEQRPDRVVNSAVHTQADFLTIAKGVSIQNAVGASWFPDYRLEFAGDRIADNSNVNSWIKYIDDCVNYRKANSSIQATTSVSGNVVTVKVRVQSNADLSYNINAMLTEDGIVGQQHFEANKVENDYVHNYTFRDIAVGQLFGTSTGIVKKGEFSEEKTLTLELNDTYKRENCKVVIYAAKRDEMGSIAVDNAVVCPLEGSVDIQFDKE